MTNSTIGRPTGGEGAPAAGGQLITVQVKGQRFALNVMAVREIRGWTPSTHLPHAPGYILGMVNLRGVVLVVIDLGLLLGLGATAPTASSVVVVAEIGDRAVGLMVDAVCDIVAVTEKLLQAAPEVESERSRDLIDAIMTTEEGIVSLLSLDHILPDTLPAAA